MKSFHPRKGRPPNPGHKAHVSQPSADHDLRVDTVLVAQGLAESRTAAQRLIDAGRVLLSGVVVKRASTLAPDPGSLEVIPDPADRYVSRGGLKLAGALERTGLVVRGLHCLDVGQSTGGFTDCLLQAGAASVLGVDVGRDQLHPRLRDDARNSTLEGINARQLSPSDVNDQLFDLIVCDASFISVTLLLPCWPALLAPGGRVLSLVKPQFELQPADIGKGGLVKNPARYADVEARIRGACAEAGLQVLDWFESPITGGDGNREFFISAHIAG
jgi:23S rRNA (cytidine1920-2'-O)/16S rRNA (cytidine1409-2'-O)-methyltransferase